MEVPGGPQTKALVCLYEFVGTAILIIAVNFMAGPQTLGAALFCIAFFLGPICGGHVNPAVTVGVWITMGLEKMMQNLVFVALIIFSQLCGAGFGCFLVWTMQHVQDNKSYHPGIASLCPAATYANIKMDGMVPVIQCAPANGMAAFNLILAETVGTFIFISVVLAIKFNGVQREGAITCLAAGGTLFGAASIAAPISGAAINPAVGIVQTIFQTIMFNRLEGMGDKYGYGSIHIYIIGPLLGGILAGIWFNMNNSIVELQKGANND